MKKIGGNFRMRTYLVTGGAGFIGSNYIHYMFRKYGDAIRIINVDALTYAGNLENLKDVENRENYTFIKADIRDREAIEKIFEENEIDRVVHFAAESHVDRSIRNPEIFVETNVLGTLVMLNAAKKAWELPDGSYKEDKRFIERYKNRGLSQAQAEYAAIVEGMDKSLGDLMDYLDEKGISENTVVVFMSDNGGYINSRGDDMNAPLSGGKGSLLEGGIREPMIVYWPGVSRAGSEEDMPVIVEDFFPTFLEMAGVKRYRTPQRVDGKSFVPVLRGKNIRGERPLFFHYPNNWGERKGIVGVPQSAIIKGNMKYIYCYENGESFLYDLDRDISERHNLMNDRMYAEVADVLRRELSDYLRRQKANMPVDKRSGEQVAYPDGKK